MRVGLGFVLIAACGGDDSLQFPWTERGVLCSLSVDDITDEPQWERAYEELAFARDERTVALLHAHDPGRTIEVASLERLFERVGELGLAYVTYPELVPAAPRAGIALAFDDHSIDSWYALRPLFATHGVRATFFVTRMLARTSDELDELAMLAADGHAIEAHGLWHLNVEEVVAEKGVEGYLADEALPSIAVLRDAGYPVASFAYPFGKNIDAVDAVLLDHVARLRVSPGSCPH